MKLQELLKGVAVLSSTADGEAEIGEVRYDSRAVGKGDLFVAIRGYATDGHKYIEKALEQGAAAVVCEEAPEGVPAVVVENSRKALAEIAANRFGHPADSMVMLGVTGTNVPEMPKYFQALISYESNLRKMQLRLRIQVLTIPHRAHLPYAVPGHICSQIPARTMCFRPLPRHIKFLPYIIFSSVLFSSSLLPFCHKKRRYLIRYLRKNQQL